MLFVVSLCAACLAHTDSLHRDSTRKDSLTTITVTTTRTDRRAPATSIHLDTLQLKLTPANSPWEILRETAGLEAHEQGQGPGFASDLSIRGFSSDHSTDMALYVDGVPNNEPVNGHAEGYNDLNLLFPQIITSVDVTKGPISALYGNFAMGGAVSVQTMDKYDGSDIELGGGAFGNAQGYGIVGFDHGTTGAVFAISGNRDDGWRTHSGDQYGHAHAGYMQQLSPNMLLDASADGYLTSYQSPGFLDTTDYNAGNYNYVSNFGDGGFKRHSQERVSLLDMLTPDLSWTTTVYSQQGTWNFWLSTPPGLSGLTEGRGVETHEYDGRYGFGGTSALKYANSIMDVAFGIDTRYTHAHYENYAEFSPPTYRADSAALEIAEPAEQTSGAVFVQGDIDATRYVRFTLGGRLDQLSSSVVQPEADTSNGNLVLDSTYYSQHSKGIFSPKTGILIRPLVDLGVPGLGIFANISRGFRQTDGVITDPTLPFILLWDHEAGVKYDGGPISASATLFRMDVSNDQTFDDILGETVGGGGSRRNGLDVDARVDITRGVSANTDFTILHAFYTSFSDPNDTTHDYNGQPIFNTSKYVGSAMIDIHLPTQAWLAQIGTNVQGPYTPFDEYGILRPGFLLFTATAGLHVYHHMELLVDGRNLLNTKYRELESGGQVAPGQPRTIYVFLRSSL